MFVGARSLKSLLQIVDNSYQLHQYSCFIFDKDQIMQLKPLFTLLPVVLSSVVQAQENTEQAVDETVTVHGQSIPSDQRTRSDLDKVRGIANADIFSGITSVQSNNMHNEAGALDIGIRGVQGEGRVPIFIDGSLQSTHTSRGYQGVSDRTYIDTDLLSSLTVNKGATIESSPYASGAVGGVVNATTLGIKDIIKDDQAFGVVLKARANNHNRTPDVSGDYSEQSQYALDERGEHSAFKHGSLMLGLGYQAESFNTVLAYSKRSKGNHFAGKKGYEEYQEPVVGQGQEVVNTSFESDSWLFKLASDTGTAHNADFNYRHHAQKAGEVLMAYWYKSSEDWEGNPYPDGKDRMPQWGLGTAKVNTYSANYYYQPDHPWLNLNANFWYTEADLAQYNGLWALGTNAEQYFHAYHNDRSGLSLTNETLLTQWPVRLNYGLAQQNERLSPEEDGQTRFTKTVTSRHGKRTAQNLFANADIDYSPLRVQLGLNLHNAKSTDYQTKQQLDYKEKLDLLSEFTYALTPSTQLFLKSSRTYRMPSLYETTLSNEVFSYNPYNPIKPEQAWNNEVGVQFMASDSVLQDDRLNLSVSYFRNSIKDFISGGRLAKTPGMSEWQANFTFTNYDKLQLSGWELGAHYQYAWLYTHFAATLYSETKICSVQQAQYAESDTCNSLGFAWGLTPTRIPPKQNLYLNVGTKFFNDTLDSGVKVSYHSGKSNPSDWLAGTAANPILEIPSDYTIDLYSQYELNANTQLFFAINNVTDRYQVRPGSVVSMPDPGRTITLGFEISY
ncbi:TonB-dependent receptor domain-containing protein [Vibrio cholerae]|uniref:TonB-dependent receptor domain-containing protein n=1 Tax=Vibrio cholerae TaxID=666 RepID=UPI000E0B7E05